MLGNDLGKQKESMKTKARETEGKVKG